MVTLADFSDTASLVSCSHCGQFLQEGDRFCRFCGHEQEISPDAEVITLTDSLGPDFMPRATAAPPAGRRGALQSPPFDDPAFAPGMARGGGISPARWILGIAAVVLVVLAAYLLHDLYRGEQDESTRRAELGTALSQVESALARGDLNEVQLKLDILDALNPNDPDVKARRQAFDRRVLELTAERDRLRAAVGKEQGGAARDVVKATDVQPAAATPAPAPAPTSAPAPAPAATTAASTPSREAATASAPRESAISSPVPATPATAPPAPPAASAPGVAGPVSAPAAAPQGTAPCPEALAAMALCPNR
ncbi:zinc ribbon domain-containing protein [Variovorax sp. OV329]|uniref:zinc ribbon domain-containing protein n=1 Tax=Variovorax sp. OV329 TaxID=1882825 RepID=UPI0008EFA183|nr:zinc ribbon domain-containing protein [Variovorax sp. OV329]SFM28437.1 zinc-ribbon domain-containing protein [Variovorax sp. OV329]